MTPKDGKTAYDPLTNVTDVPPAEEEFSLEEILAEYGGGREKLMRDVKVFQIFEGTNQIQRMTIANVLNKEYT